MKKKRFQEKNVRVSKSNLITIFMIFTGKSINIQTVLKQGLKIYKFIVKKYQLLKCSNKYFYFIDFN